MGCNSTVDLLLLSAFTIALKASFNILLPIFLSLHSKLENQMQRNCNPSHHQHQMLKTHFNQFHTNDVNWMYKIIQPDSNLTQI
jgi:hypothetical protein